MVLWKDKLNKKASGKLRKKKEEKAKITNTTNENGSDNYW